MAWLAVDKLGNEYKFTIKPKRWDNGIIPVWSTMGRGNRKDLPTGSIEKLIGRKLTWDDEPVEMT